MNVYFITKDNKNTELKIPTFIDNPQVILLQHSIDQLKDNNYYQELTKSKPIICYHKEEIKNDSLDKTKVIIEELPSEKDSILKAFLYWLKETVKQSISNEEKSDKVVLLDSDFMNSIVIELMNWQASYNESQLYEFGDNRLSIIKFTKEKLNHIECLNLSIQ